MSLLAASTLDGFGFRSKMIDAAKGVRARAGSAVGPLTFAVALVLPWSTSATAILIPLWLLALLSNFDIAALLRTLRTPAGFLPVALWFAAVVAMSWAHVPWHERLSGLDPYWKLLVIPIVMSQMDEEHANRALRGFLWSCCALLAYSFAMLTWCADKDPVLVPGFPWHSRQVGVPVKDYMAQSGVFVLCAFGLLAQRGHGRFRIAALTLAAAFLANILFVATSRTTIVVIPAFVLLTVVYYLGRKGMLIGGVAAVLAISAVWLSSPHLAGRAALLFKPQTIEHNERLQYWAWSLDIVRGAPLLGHGTGSMKTELRAAAIADPAAGIGPTTNPHNQPFAIAISLGILGMALLFAMWGAHLALFAEAGKFSWLGLLIVAQNILSGAFNSHLFDFTQGWLYVIGVGIIGGVLQHRASPARRPAAATQIAIGAREFAPIAGQAT